MHHPASPIAVLLAVLGPRRSLERTDRGASAVEWTLIATIALGLCIIVAAVLAGALDGS